MIEEVYNNTNDALVRYYNKPYNFTKLTSLMGEDFSKLLETSFIAKIYQAKKALHSIEKQYTFDKVQIEIANSLFVIREHKLDKEYRIEAHKHGMVTESAILAHTDFKKTDFNIEYEKFDMYRQAIETLMKFFRSENRNIEGLLSQAKALSYSGYKYSDDTELFAYEGE